MKLTLKAAAVALMLSGALLASGCGSSKPASGKTDSGSAKADAGSTTSDSASGLSLARLGSLHNYRSVMISGMGKTRMTFKTSVHSPDNWQADSPLVTRHVDGNKYTTFDGGKTWTREADEPNAYQKTGLPSIAKQFYGMTHVSHAKISRGKPCHQAGTAGHTWSIGADGGQTLRERFSACVADDSGALLKLVVGADGTATGEQHASEVFKIVSIGNVPAFPVPQTEK